MNLTRMSRRHVPGNDAHVPNHAAINIKDRIKDEAAQRLVSPGAAGCARRWPREFPRYRCLLGAGSIASSAGIARISSKLLLHRGDVRIRQVDLVDHRDDGEALFVREMNVRHRLRLHALRGVHDQQRALAGARLRETS